MQLWNKILWLYVAIHMTSNVNQGKYHALTGLDAPKQVKLLPIQHKQSSWIESK